MSIVVEPTKKIIGYYLVLQETNDTFPWSIHGLWPEYEGDYHNYPKCQCNSKSTVEPSLLNEMHNDWHSEKRFHHTDKWLWHHEWKKHGACIFHDSKTYFQFTIKIFNYVKSKGLNWFIARSIKHVRERWLPLDINFKTKKIVF